MPANSVSRPLISFAFAALISLQGYFISRHETWLLLTTFGLLAFLFAWVYLKEEDTDYWIRASLIFRLLLLFATPWLSEDIYRYLWDGELLVAGIHPFDHVPSWYAAKNFFPGDTAGLYTRLNSPDYFTIYPPAAQYLFGLCAWLSKSAQSGILFFRIIILLFELGAIFLLQYAASAFRFNKRNVLIYALNPLVILEVTGNLHLEGIMIFFLLLAITLLARNRWITSSLSMCVSIAMKLVPLMFLPLLIRSLGWRRSVMYFIVLGVSLGIIAIPVLNNSIFTGYETSLPYYFKKFEFNASVYYLIREWGYLQYGYNIIGDIGWKLGAVTALTIIVFSLLKNFNLWEKMLFSLTVFLLLSTTVHPWYIIPAVALSVFTRHSYPAIWSILIFFTYAGYSENGFREDYQVVVVEYVLVLVVIMLESGRKISFLYSPHAGTDHVLQESNSRKS